MRFGTGHRRVLERFREGTRRRNGRRLDNTFGSAILVLLLASEVVSLLAGTETIFFASIVTRLARPSRVVGLRNVLDAGCLFMLVSLGIVVVVDAAGHRIPFAQLAHNLRSSFREDAVPPPSFEDSLDFLSEVVAAGLGRENSDCARQPHLDAPTAPWFCYQNNLTCANTRSSLLHY